MELTRQDLDTLIEAVEAWESKDAAGEMMGGLLSCMMSRGATPEEKARIQEQEQKEKRKRDDERRLRKERSIVLRARLLRMRDSQDADAVLDAVAATRF